MEGAFVDDEDMGCWEMGYLGLVLDLGVNGVPIYRRGRSEVMGIGVGKGMGKGVQPNTEIQINISEVR